MNKMLSWLRPCHYLFPCVPLKLPLLPPCSSSLCELVSISPVVMVILLLQSMYSSTQHYISSGPSVCCDCGHRTFICLAAQCITHPCLQLCLAPPQLFPSAQLHSSHPVASQIPAAFIAELPRTIVFFIQLLSSTPWVGLCTWAHIVWS